MSDRKVRMGIDVGGTHTKAVAIDNATHEIIGKSSVKTTHDDKAGVATGVVQAFKNCLKENNIDPKDVIFVAHSTTQATNSLIEGDVAQVGVIGMGGKGPGGWLAKVQTGLKDIDLGSGRSIKLHNRYLVDDTLSDDTVTKAIKDLLSEGAQVIVARTWRMRTASAVSRERWAWRPLPPVRSPSFTASPAGPAPLRSTPRSCPKC